MTPGCKSLLCAIAAVALWLASGAAHAQEFPDRPLRIVVGFAPGGIVDTLARIIAEALAQGLGKGVIVENRAGAGGTIAAGAVAKAAPDGYTLLLNATSDVINPIINKQVEYGIETSFSPVGLVASAPNVLVVHPSLPVASLPELIEYARVHPGELNYGSAGIGTVSHLAGAIVAATAQVQFVHIPYKGTAAAQVDLLSGRLQFMFDGMVSALGNARAGKVRALAVTSARRWPGAPELPPVAESGFPGFDMVVWFGLLAPAGTPAPIVDRIATELSKALQNAEVRKRIAALGAETGHMTPSEFRRYIRAENIRWQKILAEGHIRIEE
jgi:tripartite-type tricarboxylate transporter receptor subunit TctC